MQIDSIGSASKDLVNIASNTEGINIWIWISIGQFLIILYLLFFMHKSEKSKIKNQFKREAKEGNIDFGNIINSSFNVNPLYNELKVKCHPDRFPNDKLKNKIALELFQNISDNRTDIKKLLELKELAKEKLNIKF